ncbi:MAG: S8 family serine peptidase, partial [Cytophagales bacterium]|nr:S8 family serine peptidase [Cytophagales bacterium]
MARGNFLLLFFLLFASSSLPIFAQNDYLIYFKDKNCSTYSISNPSAFLSEASIARRQRQNISIESRDLPVCEAYIQQVKALGVQVRYPTKWLNGVVVRISNASQLSQIASLSFVQNSNQLSRVQPSYVQLNRQQSPKDKFNVQSSDTLNYGTSVSQLDKLGLNSMHNEGITGKGVKVAIFDAGFLNANSLSCFQHIFNSGRLKATYDVSNDKPNVYDMGNHGLNVFSTMAAYQPGVLIGGAYGADFYLYHTEVVATEYPIEEANWLRAAEIADSAGVDIINSSLGYTDFDNSIFDHTYADMNG